MKFTNHTEHQADFSELRRQGTVVASRRLLTETFGAPRFGADDPSICEWWLRFEDGTLVAIYFPWYELAALPSRDDLPMVWSVGSTHPVGVAYVNAAIAASPIHSESKTIH